MKPETETEDRQYKLNYKTVLFDLDGTLINTLEDLTNVMNTALAEFDAGEITAERCRVLLGVGLRYWCENAVKDGKKHLTEKVMARFRELYNSRCLERSRPYEGIMELTDELTRRGVKQAVVTNKNEDISAFIVKEVFGDEKFPIVRGANNGIGCKPDPTAVLEVLEAYKTKPEEAIFVGDGEADIDVAINAAVKSVWVSWGFRKIEELAPREPDVIVHHPLEILELFQRTSASA